MGLFAPWPALCVVWLVFCAASFALFLRLRAASLSACVPFVFSNIAALWLVAGANDLRLLRYDPFFSYYAALHGNVIGWILIGTLAVLAGRAIVVVEVDDLDAICGGRCWRHQRNRDRDRPCRGHHE